MPHRRSRWVVLPIVAVAMACGGRRDSARSPSPPAGDRVLHPANLRTPSSSARASNGRQKRLRPRVATCGTCSSTPRRFVERRARELGAAHRRAPAAHQRPAPQRSLRGTTAGGTDFDEHTRGAGHYERNLVVCGTETLLGGAGDRAELSMWYFGSEGGAALDLPKGRGAAWLAADDAESFRLLDDLYAGRIDPGSASRPPLAPSPDRAKRALRRASCPW